MRAHSLLALSALLGLCAASSCRWNYEVRGNEGESPGGGGGGQGGEVVSSGGQGGAPGAGGTGGALDGTGGEEIGGAAGSGGADPFVWDEPYCERLPYLSAVPTVDGVLEADLPLQEIVPAGFHPVSCRPTDTLPEGVTMRYAAAWLNEGLYIYLEVTDPDRAPAEEATPLWQGDGVEIYLDHDAVFAPSGSYDDEGTFQFVLSAPPDDVQNGSGGEIYHETILIDSWDDTSYAVVPRAFGYVVEAILRADDLSLASWSPGPGSPFGFSLGHNVSLPVGESDCEGNRLGQYFLKAGEPFTGIVDDYPFYNSNVFCTPELVDEGP